MGYAAAHDEGARVSDGNPQRIRLRTAPSYRVCSHGWLLRGQPPAVWGGGTSDNAGSRYKRKLLAQMSSILGTLLNIIDNILLKNKINSSLDFSLFFPLFFCQKKAFFTESRSVQVNGHLRTPLLFV